MIRPCTIPFGLLRVLWENITKTGKTLNTHCTLKMHTSLKLIE